MFLPIYRRLQYAGVHGRSMWLPKDDGTWIGLISLLLVVPLSFFSMWSYPRLENWWAARSRKALRNRIEKLKTALAHSMRVPEMSVAEEWPLLFSHNYCVRPFDSHTFTSQFGPRLLSRTGGFPRHHALCVDSTYPEFRRMPGPKSKGN